MNMKNIRSLRKQIYQSTSRTNQETPRQICYKNLKPNTDTV